MATNFPTALDTSTQLPNPAAGNNTNSPSHSSLHGNENGAIIALETKVGIGATTPAANTLLFGTGAGTSSWTALTSAQLAATLSDETGTGSVVFANTPTLITPKVDTINENTPANGVTIDGLNIKDNKLNTNNSVVTANITDANVTNPKLQNTGAFNSSWAWTSFTSTPTNFTLGNGTMVGRYTQTGKMVYFELYIKLGSTSSMGTAPTFTLPVTANSRYDTATFPSMISIGQFTNYDVSATSTYWGIICIASTTTFVPAPMRTDFTWVNNPANVITAGQPAAAYATGDLLWFAGTYEAA
jgi:hypothetical protein